MSGYDRDRLEAGTPVTTSVLWDNPDHELKLIGALIELCERADQDLDDVNLRRVTAYLAERYKDTK